MWPYMWCRGSPTLLPGYPSLGVGSLLQAERRVEMEMAARLSVPKELRGAMARELTKMRAHIERVHLEHTCALNAKSP